MRQKFEPRGGPAMCRTQKKAGKHRFVVSRSEHWPHRGSNPEHPTLQISALPAGLNYTYLIVIVDTTAAPVLYIVGQ